MLTNNFDSAGGGTYSFRNGTSTSTGTITNYTWIQEAYRGRLWPIYYSGVVPMTLYLNFTGGGGGIFNGTAYGSPPASVSGTFMLN